MRWKKRRSFNISFLHISFVLKATIVKQLVLIYEHFVAVRKSTENVFTAGVLINFANFTLRILSFAASDYEDLEKPDLISLVLSYDEKVKALTSEVAVLSKSKEEAVQNKGVEKDKYKALARRLKEERNTYKETCDEKL